MDRSLATLLRSLQASRNTEDAGQLLPSATGLLSRLSNPLNITLLASQLLASPLLFPIPVNLSSCRGIFSVFYTAALRFAEDEKNDNLQHSRSNLSRIEWTKAIVKGADNNSPRWRHTLLLGGTLLGFEGQEAGVLPNDLRSKIELALITATNLALQEKDARDANNQLCLIFVLNSVFPLISDHHRAQLHHDLLLPELIDGVYFSKEGLEHGYWLGAIDRDIYQISKTQFQWSAKSLSAGRMQDMKSRPLIASLGPFARLIAHSIESVKDAVILVAMLARLAEFSRNIALSWRQNKLSEIDPSEEGDFLDSETRRTTLPELLQLLRNILYSLIICLRAMTGRLVVNARLSADRTAPFLASQTLHILRDTYFISHRFGQHSYSQYLFVHYTAIDILNQFPAQAESFLSSIKSADAGRIPPHPLERLHGLFYLNVAEHFTLVLRPEANEELLVTAAMPYITTQGDRRLMELYEAAHSVFLAVFAAPQNGAISARHIPFYIETLLQSFPANLAPRQFRLAIRSIMQVAAPYSSVFVALPNLQEIILEMLHGRLVDASEAFLPTTDSTSAEAATPQSETSVILMSIIDSLRFLPVPLLTEWLPLTAESLQRLSDTMQRSECQNRFWEVLSSGEMDLERAAIGVAWWISRGGRELVLRGEDVVEMSGGFGTESRM